LTDVIQRLTENPNEKLEDLLPHRWKAKHAPKTVAEIVAFVGTPKAA
jgi:hypothetical protein